jgi:hypothetical protein
LNSKPVSATSHPQIPPGSLNRLQQQPGRQSGLADTRLTNKNQVLGLGDKLQVGEGADLLGVDARLPFEGKRFDRPGLGQSGLLDPPRQRGFVSMLVLSADESGEERAIGELVLLGMRQLVVDDRGDLLQMEIPKQLLDLVIHDQGSPSSSERMK